MVENMAVDLPLFKFQDLGPSDFGSTGRRLSFKDTDGNKGRPLKSDSAAGTLARGMVEGRYFSVQEAIAYLKDKGIIQNYPDRRLREAKSWLERQGYTVKEINCGDFKRWGI